MQEYNYPEYYQVYFPNSFTGNELTKNGVSITKSLIVAIVKNIRPNFVKKEEGSDEKVFRSSGGRWRVRIEMREFPNELYFVLDAGQDFGHYDVESFKARCEDFGTVSPDIAYCDNMPMILSGTEEPGVFQRTGVIKVYVLKEGGASSDTSRRVADDMASAFVKAINSLPDHFVVVDNEALRLL